MTPISGLPVSGSPIKPKILRPSSSSKVIQRNSYGITQTLQWISKNDSDRFIKKFASNLLGILSGDTVSQDNLAKDSMNITNSKTERLSAILALVISTQGR